MSDGRRFLFSVDQRTCWDESDTKVDVAVFYLLDVVCIASKAQRSRAACWEYVGDDVYMKDNKDNLPRCRIYGSLVWSLQKFIKIVEGWQTR
jgi:hypothetical protein